MSASRLVYAGLSASGVTSMVGYLNRRQLAILAYHGVHDGEADSFSNFDGLEIHVERFAAQMEHLSRRFRVVPLSECLGSSGGERRVVITFDDAYASVYHLAYPVLKRLGLPSTVFVPTDFVEGRLPMWWDRLRESVRCAKPPSLSVHIRGEARVLPALGLEDRLRAVSLLAEEMKTLPAPEREAALSELDTQSAPGSRPSLRREPMTVAQIRAMASAGVAFESHGKAHASLPSLAPDQALQDLLESRRLIEDWVGNKVEWVAYPFGHHDSATAGVVSGAGFRGAVTTVEGFADPTTPFTLRRMLFGDPVSLPQFRGALSGLRGLLAHAPGRES